jgi:hypothetical protein
MYRQLKAWWIPFLTLSPKQQHVLRELLETRYPGIEQQAVNLRNAQLVGFFKGFGCVALLLLLLVLIVLGGAGV